MKMLRLSNVSLTASKKEIPGFPELEELSVARSDGMKGHTDHVLDCLTRKAEKLTLLDIRGCKNISSSCILTMIPSLNMQHLAISNCDRLFQGSLETLLQKVTFLTDSVVPLNYMFALLYSGRIVWLTWTCLPIWMKSHWKPVWKNWAPMEMIHLRYVAEMQEKLEHDFYFLL